MIRLVKCASLQQKRCILLLNSLITLTLFRACFRGESDRYTSFQGPRASRCSNLEGVSEALLKVQVCTGCNRAQYCSHACQKSAWKGHKAACRAAGAAATAPQEATALHPPRGAIRARVPAEDSASAGGSARAGTSPSRFSARAAADGADRHPPDWGAHRVNRTSPGQTFNTPPCHTSYKQWLD